MLSFINQHQTDKLTNKQISATEIEYNKKKKYPKKKRKYNHASESECAVKCAIFFLNGILRKKQSNAFFENRSSIKVLIRVRLSALTKVGLYLKIHF